jgi:potassium-transporting ATPase KdpC subunit
MKRQIYPSIMMTILATVLFGLIYPLAITGLAQVMFPWRANGSLIADGGRVAGSVLIGQPFSDPKYFWGRLSATSPYPYNAASSSGSNLGPTNQALLDEVKQRIDDLHKADPGNTAPIPVDLVTSSASGLDPDISPAAAQYQAARVARVRHLPVETVEALIRRHTQGPQFGILGEPRVNVLELNRALDHTR